MILFRCSGVMSLPTPFITIIGLSFLETSAVMLGLDSPIFLSVMSMCSGLSNSTRSLLLETNCTLAGVKLVSRNETFFFQDDKVSAEDVQSFFDDIMSAGLVTGGAVTAEERRGGARLTSGLEIAACA